MRAALQLYPVALLRQIAQRHHLPTRGTKEHLIDRIADHINNMAGNDGDGQQQQQAPPPGQPNQQQQAQLLPTPAQQRAAIQAEYEEQYLMYSDAALIRLFTIIGLDDDGVDSKEERAEILARTPGLTPDVAFRMLTSPTPNTNKVKIDTSLPKQDKSERVETFLARAQVHFQLVQPDDNQSILMLIGAAQPEIAAFASKQFQSGVATIADMIQAIKTRFTPNRFQYFYQFSHYCMKPNQTIREAGNELHQLYLLFAELEPDELIASERLITATVTATLLQIIPQNIAGMLKAEIFRNPDITWDTVLQLADRYHQERPAKARSNATNTPAGPRKHCQIHGVCAHNDTECRNQRNQSQGTSQTAQCYKCWQFGHMANACPTNQQYSRPNRTGNDKSGSV
ncbi:MAG: hypothetical protein NHG36_15610 [Chromatiaceae bacterium]|nr:hypothetical protein [Candidatus Thioaporhodococcus sediminis]